MYYKQYYPCKELRPHIRSYFDVQVDPGAEFHFPSDGCPGLIINFGAPFLLGSSEKDIKIFTGCRLFGYLSRQLVIKSISVTKVLAVKFQPGRLTPFFSVPGIELADTSVSIETLWGIQGKERINKIYNEKSILEIIKLLDAHFLKHLSFHAPYDMRIVAALDEILNRKGQVRITNLADWTNLSRRQFERRFIKTIGLSPKRMCRIARISGIFPQLITGLKHDWADIALTGGYSDQAHFIREWKYFTGFSPEFYIRNLSSFESSIVGLNEKAQKTSHLFNTPH